ncbi:MAG: hypothetical protein O3A46_03445, partial [Candidatus Poribacteria bacterium]|nr:hypothetical protein [Candidatus Poribacteria bacterium]
DLTQQVAGTYGYLLKLTLSGQDAVVRSLRMTTWVQVAPASLPSLRSGVNRMEYRTGDHHGLPSRVVELSVRANDRDELLKHCVVPPTDWDTSRKTSRIRGEFVVKMDAPPKTRIVWLSVGGSFQTHQREAAANTRNAMLYAVDQPDDFIELYRADVPTDQAHWHYNADREVLLDAPAKTVYVKYVGDPGVNAVRIYAHCVDDEGFARRPVTITHGWSVGGEARSQSVVMEGDGAYEILVEGEPEDEFVELSVASDMP